MIDDNCVGCAKQRRVEFIGEVGGAPVYPQGNYWVPSDGASCNRASRCLHPGLRLLVARYVPLRDVDLRPGRGGFDFSWLQNSTVTGHVAATGRAGAPCGGAGAALRPTTRAGRGHTDYITVDAAGNYTASVMAGHSTLWLDTYVTGWGTAARSA